MKIKDLHGKVVAEFPDHFLAVFELPSGPVHICVTHIGDKILAACEDRSTLTASRGETNDTVYIKPWKPGDK